MKLEYLKKEHAEQDNRATAYPIYVTVQELVSIGVMAEGYTVNCPYGDGETRIEYKHKEDCELNFKSAKEMDSFLCQNQEGYTKYDFEEMNVGYIWHPVEFFLTIRGAEKYMRANSHNHGKLRTYVDHFNRRNFEMRALLDELGFKTKDYGEIK